MKHLSMFSQAMRGAMIVAGLTQTEADLFARQLVDNRSPRDLKMKAEDKSAEILIYDVIGATWDGGILSKDFVEQLAGLGDVDNITVRINSPGGNVFEGVAIYNALKSHPATINVQVDSLAASIASVIAMAGDTISISDSAMFMIHNPATYAYGDENDFRAVADLLNKIRGAQLMGAYARTGKTPEELADYMDAETWFTAQEAVTAGFADKILNTGTNKAAAPSESFDLSGFKNVPKSLWEAYSGAKKQPKKDPIPPENEGKSPEIQQIALIAAQARDRNLRLAELS
jgi:ATP-dependent protease ClpP protease subunit